MVYSASGGDVLLQPPPSHHHQEQPYYDLTGNQSPGSGNSGNNVVDYEPARPPPPPPPPQQIYGVTGSVPPEESPTYGNGRPAYPFKGPLTIYYGFKPVATPYGNLSVGKEYGSSFKRYENILVPVNDQGLQQQQDYGSQYPREPETNEQPPEQYNLNDITHPTVQQNDEIEPTYEPTYAPPSYGDYPDFNDDPTANVPNMNNEPDLYSYRNTYKRDLSSIQRSGTGSIQRNLQISPEDSQTSGSENNDEFSLPKYNLQTLPRPKQLGEIIIPTMESITSRKRRDVDDEDDNEDDVESTQSDSNLLENSSLSALSILKILPKIGPESHLIGKRDTLLPVFGTAATFLANGERKYKRSVSNSPEPAAVDFSSPYSSSTSQPLPISRAQHAIDSAMTSAIGFVADMTELGVSVLSNFVSGVNSFANAISNKLSVTDSRGSSRTSRVFNSSNISSTTFTNNRTNDDKSKTRKSKPLLYPTGGSSTFPILLIPRQTSKNESLSSYQRNQSVEHVLNKFLHTNQLMFSNKNQSSRGNSSRSSRKRKSTVEPIMSLNSKSSGRESIPGT
ncbi:unnamed protein product [Orchesella dallaii]|uniref:Uncharacterized protein n=1 Tax=Orchesella dallaii TaxID=48710 RepID=A0ABP1S5T8_9HEXA